MRSKVMRIWMRFKRSKKMRALGLQRNGSKSKTRSGKGGLCIRLIIFVRYMMDGCCHVE